MSSFKKNMIWAGIFFIIICICAAVFIIHRHTALPAKSAEIVQNGRVVRIVDLENVDEPYSFTVTDGDGGENTIYVEKGKIRVSHANCPDKICVNRGFISDSSVPIVCLPHKLSVVITNDGSTGYDAVAGGDTQ